MKDSPVMPDVKGAKFPNLGKIGRNPFNAPGTLAQPRSGFPERGFRDVKDGNCLEVKVKKSVDEHRRTAAHIDDSAILDLGDGPNELEREARVFLIPADARLTLR